MLGHRRWIMVLLFTVAQILALARVASAAPIVQYTVDDLGGGVFQYNLSVNNAGGSEALSGLNILKADSVFGLDGTSEIAGPAGWMFFPPVPGLVHDLDYFSLAPGTDVPKDGTLGGFWFRSPTDPTSIAGDDFEVEGIGASSATQIALGNAQPVPEPSSWMLVASGLAGFATLGRERRRNGA